MRKKKRNRVMTAIRAGIHLNQEQQKLVVTNMAIARKVAEKVCAIGEQKGLSTEELQQEAYLGLCLAAIDYHEGGRKSYQELAKNWCYRMVQRSINREQKQDKMSELFGDEHDEAKAEDEEENREQLELREAKMKQVDVLVENLNGLERKVVRLHFGLYKKYKAMSFTRIASTLAISKTRVLQIYDKAMAKMKQNY